ncbi:MAG: hypothetical protein WB797_11140, partial [Nocardioides sp.]
AGRAAGSAERTAREPLDVTRLLQRVLPALMFAALLVVFVRLSAVPLDNTDTYFHLRFGEEFLHHWSLRHPGSVSTFATAHWVPTQWLPEIVMAKFGDWFGLAGVAWLSGVQQLGLVAALYVVARRWADPLVVVLVLIPTLAACSIGLSMRPQVLSYILAAVFVGAWLKTRDDGRPRWWLVPLTWLWAMLHGMWPIGIGLGVVGVAGLALDRRLGRRELVRVALVPIGSAVVGALTPVGPALYGAVLGVGSRSRFFSEWKSPDYTAVPACMALALLLAVVAVLFLRSPRRTWTETLFFLTAGACALWSYRTVPVAAVVLMPLMARAIQGRVPGAPLPVRRAELWSVAGGCATALAVLAIAVPRTSDEPFAQPSWVDPALSSLPAGTKVVSDWDYGGYLMWRFPQLDLLAHGYGDTFTIAELQRNTDIIEVAPNWDTELKATGVTVAVLKPKTPLAYALEHDTQPWTVVHRSTSMEMLTAPPGWTS